MTLTEIHAKWYAVTAYDQLQNIRHFDCGNGERYSLPVEVVLCGPWLEGYSGWVARIEAVRSAARG